MLSLNNPQNSLELANVDVAAEVAEGAALGSARCVVDNDDEACKSSFWGAEKPKRKKNDARIGTPENFVQRNFVM